MGGWWAVGGRWGYFDGFGRGADDAALAARRVELRVERVDLGWVGFFDLFLEKVKAKGLEEAIERKKRRNVIRKKGYSIKKEKIIKNKKRL